ncbi:MAG TPA: hypothetical protein ENN06_10600 [Desulfobacteraceae bacterium]|nr:hypothetical protein [Desulfobacteraceae bacterium]
MRMNMLSLFLAFIFTVSLLPGAFAEDDRKPPGKKWPEQGAGKSINGGKAKSKRYALPPWLDEKDRKAWKDGRPPGWDRGRKTGWQGGDLPPGQARKRAGGTEYAPGSRYRWTEQERNRHEERIKNAEERIRELLEKKGATTGPMLDSATLSLYSAVNRGVPVSTASAVIEQGIERGLSPEGIEQVTRALSYGTERQRDFTDLEKIIRDGMNRGLNDEELTMEVYRALSK